MSRTEDNLSFTDTLKTSADLFLELKEKVRFLWRFSETKVSVILFGKEIKYLGGSAY